MGHSGKHLFDFFPTFGPEFKHIQSFTSVRRQLTRPMQATLYAQIFQDMTEHLTNEIQALREQLTRIEQKIDQPTGEELRGRWLNGAQAQ